jgi:hypothetical protein
MRIAIFVLALTTLMCASAAADTIPFMVPAKDENLFTTDCVVDGVSCVFSRTHVLKGGVTRQVLLQLFDTTDEQLMAITSVDGGVVWRQNYDCTATKIDMESVYGIGKDGAKIELSSRIGNTALNEKVCRSSLNAEALEDARDSGARFLVVRRSTSTAMLGKLTTGEIRITNPVRNRHMLGTMPGALVFLDSSRLSDGMRRGALDGVIYIEEEPSERSDDRFLLFSTVGSWAEVAKDYGRTESELIPVPLRALAAADGQRVGDKLLDAKRIVSGLANQIEYRMLWGEAGSTPVNPPSVVMGRGYGDCRDMVTLLINELRANGIQAVSVMTSTASPMPRSLSIPDMSWANHVVVLAPELGVYFDLTAGPGHKGIGPESKVFGAIGFRTDTGEPVVIR